MSDGKKAKIAAAKKKLRQFQQRSGCTLKHSLASVLSSPASDRKSSEDNLRVIQTYHQSGSPTLGKPITDQQNRIRSARRKREVLDTIDEGPVLDHIVQEGNIISRTSASTESLHQLSRQLNGLLNESVDLNANNERNSKLDELEIRNRELAALLEKQSHSNEHLFSQNRQLGQLAAERHAFNDNYKKDVTSLKDQLQIHQVGHIIRDVHIQTIGILVAEKTELQSQVGQSKRIADQRLEEIEDFSGRSKASRQQISDLERSLSAFSQTGQYLEKTNKENVKTIDRLKSDMYKSIKSGEESQQQISEMNEKLYSKVSEVTLLEQSVDDLKRRLEMAEIYAQQLSNEHSTASVQMLTALQMERDDLALKVKLNEEMAESARLERDKVRDQCQSQSAKLTLQIQQLSDQVSGLSQERDQLSLRSRDMESRLVEQQREMAKKMDDFSRDDYVVDYALHQKIMQDLDRRNEEIDYLQARHAEQTRDNAQLSRIVEEREHHIQELDRLLGDMGSQLEDRTTLLDSIHSDRAALSRALTQNKELKCQLAELQNSFVKMSNDNVELVTRLQGCEHTSNDLMAKLSTREDELSVSEEALAHSQSEAASIREASDAAQGKQLQQDHLQDRLHHYEAQAELVDTLQNDLTAAQDIMDALTVQNSELRTMLIKATDVNSRSHASEEERPQTVNLVDSLQATIGQLELERGQLFERLKEQRQLSDNLGVKVADLQEQVIRRSAVENEKIARSEYDHLRSTMDLIETKYTHVMQDKAELSDRADRLEHLVVQLQGETDTIGEYISLYHHQRALLHQRELQKNKYIAQLAQDREQMQGKLGELQVLVMQMLGEKDLLHSYHTEMSAATVSTHPVNGPAVAPIPSNSACRNGVSPELQPQMDWPDYTSSDSETDSEVEPITGVSGAEVPSDFSRAVSHSDTSLAPCHILPERSDDDVSLGGSVGRRFASPVAGESDGSTFISPEGRHQTAHRILSLLSEIGHSNAVSKLPLAERDFLPCKFCKGVVQIV